MGVVRDDVLHLEVFADGVLLVGIRVDDSILGLLPPVVHFQVLQFAFVVEQTQMRTWEPTVSRLQTLANTHLLAFFVEALLHMDECGLPRFLIGYIR